MINKLSTLVTAEQVGIWLVIALLAAYFIYKEWPEFIRRITQGALKEQQEEQEDRSVSQRLDSIESEVKQINSKLERDYYRINEMEKKLRKTRELQADVNKELEIIMRALLGVLRGLQEQGTNGTTKKAEEEINNYLTEKAHKSSHVDE